MTTTAATPIGSNMDAILLKFFHFVNLVATSVDFTLISNESLSSFGIQTVSKTFPHRLHYRLPLVCLLNPLLYVNTARIEHVVSFFASLTVDTESYISRYAFLTIASAALGLKSSFRLGSPSHCSCSQNSFYVNIGFSFNFAKRIDLWSAYGIDIIFSI